MLSPYTSAIVDYCMAVVSVKTSQVNTKVTGTRGFAVSGTAQGQWWMHQPVESVRFRKDAKLSINFLIFAMLNTIL